MKNDQIEIYKLQPKQLEFCDSFAKYRLFGGARGGGKSYAMRAEAVRQCLSCDGIHGLVLRRTFPEIRENMVIPMLTELPKELAKYNQTHSRFEFVNGSTLRFSYCRNLKDVLNYQGTEYQFICIEELTHWNELEWKYLMASLRTSRDDFIPNFFASTNPGGIGHYWVKRLWIDHDYQRNEKREDYIFIPAKVYDNKILIKNNPEYLQQLKDLPDMQRRAMLDGDWDVFEGQYFTEFNRSVHVIKPIIPKIGIKKRVISIDYGYGAPSAVYWSVITNQNDIVVYRELYQERLLIQELAEKIVAMTPKEEMKEIQIVPTDPSILSKTNEATRKTGTQYFADGGLPQVIPANNDRVLGWQMMKRIMRVNDDQNFGKKSRLKITSDCEKLISTLPGLIFDKNNTLDLDTRGDDHSADSLRYGIMELIKDEIGLAELDQVQKDFLLKNNDYDTIGAF